MKSPQSRARFSRCGPCRPSTKRMSSSGTRTRRAGERASESRAASSLPRCAQVPRYTHCVSPRLARRTPAAVAAPACRSKDRSALWPRAAPDGLVDGRALALIDRRRIPPETEPAQVLDRLPGKAARAAGRVEILNAQQKPPARMARGQIGQQRAQQVAQVQPSAGVGAKRPVTSGYIHSPSSCFMSLECLLY